MDKKILLIDSDSEQRKNIVRVLETHGYAVKTMETTNALERATRVEHPDLILCNMMLPDSDGVTVCRRLGSDAQTRCIPIILLSEEDCDGQNLLAMEAGATAHLAMFSAAEELLQSVQTALVDRVFAEVWGCRGSIPAPERATGRYGGNTTCITVLMPGGIASSWMLEPGCGSLATASTPRRLCCSIYA